MSVDPLIGSVKMKIRRVDAEVRGRPAFLLSWQLPACPFLLLTISSHPMYLDVDARSWRRCGFRAALAPGRGRTSGMPSAPSRSCSPRWDGVPGARLYSFTRAIQTPTLAHPVSSTPLQVKEIQKMADQSEVMVQEICRDIKKLDFAKVGGPPRPAPSSPLLFAGGRSPPSADFCAGHHLLATVSSPLIPLSPLLLLAAPSDRDHYGAPQPGYAGFRRRPAGRGELTARLICLFLLPSPHFLVLASSLQLLT